MDESLATPSESKIPLILAVIALAVGVFGAMFGYNARNRAIDLEKKLSAAELATTQAQDSTARVQQLEAIVAAMQKDAQDMQEFKGQAIGALQQASGAYNVLRKDVDRLVGISSGGRPVGNAGGGTTTPPNVVAGADEYVIVAGDTLSKVAAKHGVRLADLQAVNPGVDSSKLRIGQKIKLPAKR